jgi:hypothetical protein
MMQNAKDWDDERKMKVEKYRADDEREEKEYMARKEKAADFVK